MAGPSTARSEGGATRSFLTLGAGEALARGVAFVATIYLARTLGVEGYGVIGVAMAVLLYLNRIVDWGMELGLGIRAVAGAREAVAQLIPAMLTARLLIAIVVALVIPPVAHAVLPSLDATVFSLYGLTLLVVAVNPRWAHLGLERPGRVAQARVLGELCTFALVVALVREPDDVVWVPVAQLVGDAACAALLHGFLVFREGVRFRFRLDPVVKPFVQPGGYLVLSALLGLMIYNADWVLLRIFHDASAVGYYAAAYAMVSFFLNLGGTYGASLLPVLTRSAQEGEHQQISTYQSAAAQVFALGLPVAIGATLVAGQIIETIFGPEYAPAAPVLQILIWSLPVALLRDTALMGLMVRGLEGRVLRLTAWAAIVNLALNLLLIPRWGMLGAAAATVLGEGGRMAIAIVYVRREGFLFVGPGRLWRALLAGGVMAMLLLPLQRPALWVAIPLGMLAYAVFLFLLGGIRVQRGSFPALSV